MKWARVLLWGIGAEMCVISILIFTRPIDVFDRVDQPKPLSETEGTRVFSCSGSQSSRSSKNRTAAAGATRGFSCSGSPHLVPAGIEPQQQDQLDELHLDPPAQNSPHAIAPGAEPAAAETAPATQSESPATAEAIEVPSPVESPSPAAPKDEFVTITSAAGVHNGPSASADIIGRAYAGARARVASRDAGWAQIVDPASGNTGWVDSRLLVPSPTTETAATEDPLGEAPDGPRDRSLEDQSAQTSKSAHSAPKSKHAAKAKRHRANHHHYGRPRFAFRFFFRSFRR
jgi:Bacterial SH3 domain